MSDIPIMNEDSNMLYLQKKALLIKLEVNNVWRSIGVCGIKC